MTDNWDRFNKLSEQRRNQEIKDPFNKLKELIRKRMETSFIGALASFEEAFGPLWQGEDLTEAQRMALKKWQNCREEILNNSNILLRQLMRELGRFHIGFNRNRTPIHLERKRT